MLEKFEVRTSTRCEFIDITTRIKSIVSNSGIEDGICTIFIPHTTAAVTINENADPDVQYDMKNFMNNLIPKSNSFKHMEGNSDSHLKTSMFGPQLTVIVANGNLVLGRWQGIYFCEFDGARTRSCFVKLIKG